MEEYIIDGTTYSKNQLESFASSKNTTLNDLLNSNPDIQAKTSPTNQSAFVEPGTALDMDFTLGSGFSESQEDDTWLERQYGKNFFTDFFGDIWRSGEQGWAQSKSVGENIQLFNKGVDASDEDIMAFITENQKARSLGISDEMRDFQRIYQEEGEGIWGFIKGVIANPSIIPQVFASSMATLAGSVFDADEVAYSGTAGLVGGAAIGASVSGGLLAIPGGIAGLFGGVAGAMETGLTLGELIQDELREEGKEFNKENVRDLMENEELWNKIKRRAVGRGISIGAIEAIGGGIAGKVGGRLYSGTKIVKGKTGWTRKAITEAGTEVEVGARKIAGLGAAIGIESVAGGTGEIVGRMMADQKMDVAEIGFEAIAGTATAPINLAAAVLNRPSYKIHGKKVSKEDIINQLKGDHNDILNAGIEVKNDPAFELKYNEKYKEAAIRGNVLIAGRNFLTNEEINEVVTLEKEILDAENKGLNKTETGKLLISEKKGKIKEINEKAKERGEQNVETEKEASSFLETAYDNLHGLSPEQKEKNKKLFEKDKNFSEKTIETLGGRKIKIPFVEVSNIEQLRSALIRLGVPEKELTFDYLVKEFRKGGMYKGGIMMVNTETAKNDQPFAPSHETTHLLTDLFIKDVPEIVTGIRDIIGIEQTNAVHEYMRERVTGLFDKDGTVNIFDENGKIDKEKQYKYNQEFLAYYGQALKDVNSGIKLNDNILTKIGEFITKYILRPLGFKTAGFETPAQVNEFLKAAAKEDVATTQKAIEKATQVRTIKDPKTGKPISYSQPKINQQKLNEQVDKLVGPKNEDGNYIMTKAEWDKTGITDAYNAIILGVDKDGNKLRNPITNKDEALLDNLIASKFYRETLEKLGRSIPEAVEHVKTGIGKKTSLTETLMKFNPEKNNSLIGWINKQLGKRALDVVEEYKKNLTATEKAQETFEKTGRETIDETADTDVAYTKIKGKATKEDAIKVAIILDLVGKQQLENVIDYYTNIKTETIDWSDDKLSEMNYANVKDMAPNITKKMFGETRDEQIKFIKDNAKALHELLPFGEMTRAAGEKGLKSSTHIIDSVLKNFYTKEEATEKTTGRGTTTASGLPLQIKNKFNQKVYDDLFGTNPSIGRRNQRETLLKGFISEIGRAFTNSVLRAELTNRDIDPNVIHVLGDGKSEILASQAKVVSKAGGTEIFSDAVNNFLPKFDPNIDNTNISANTLLKEALKGVRSMGLKYIKPDGTVGVIKESHLKGYVGEYWARKAILLNNPNLEIVGKKLKGPNNTGIGDLQFKDINTNKIYNVEAKFDYKGTLTLGSGTIHFINGVFTDQSTTSILPDIWLQLKTILEGKKAFINKWMKEVSKGSVYKVTQLTSPVEVKKYDEVAKRMMMTLGGVNLKNLRAINNHYEKADFIVFAEQNEIYSLGEEQFRINALEGTQQITLRINRGGSKGRPAVSTSIRAFNTDLKKKPANRKATDKNIFESKGPLASEGKVKYYNDLSIENMFKQHDHTYHYSDVRKNFDKGRKQAEIINDKIEELGGWTQELVDSWNKYAPKSMQMVFGDLTVEERGGPITDKDKATRLKEARRISGTTLASEGKVNLSREMNTILEETKGIAKDKIVGDIDALIQGRKKDKAKFWIPPSAEDFEGMTRYFAGKGKAGDRHIQFFENYLFRPLTEAQMTWDSNKLKADLQWKDIRKAIKKSGIDLNKQVKSKLEPNLEKYTNEQVIRAAMWLGKGTPVDGIDVKEASSIMRYVRTELEFTGFMEQLYNIFPEKLYPTLEKVEAKHWLSGTILTDILDSFNNKNTRAEYFKEFWNNADQIFGTLSKDKLVGPIANKIRSLYGDSFMDSLGNMLHRIKTGRNREYGPDKHSAAFMNWTNDAVGTIMFFNTRSALLQMISFANFINWSDNNAIAATARFLDQKQYWSDFAMIFNSDFLKSRRKGLRTDVNADEIASAAAKSTNKFRAVLSTILKLGFLPTQIADSIAIATGGASFYRNRYNSLIEGGMSKKDAEKQAFRDFQSLTTAAQQSSLPWRVSKQQAGPLGRIILAFQNTPMQYARLIKKAAMDLKNGRGDWKTNLSKLTYYAAIQNIIFHGLQSALFALMFTDEDEEERKKAYQNVGNRVADSLLIGTGIYGAIAATTKNVILEVISQAKSGRRDFEKAAIKSTSLSPPLSSKLQKLLRASRRFQYKQEREKIREMGLSSQNPAVISAGEILSAVFNLPADRAIRKWNNLVKAADSETELWQSIALSLGYSEWDVKLMENQKEPEMGIKRRTFESKKFESKKFESKKFE